MTAPFQVAGGDRAPGHLTPHQLDVLRDVLLAELSVQCAALDEHGEALTDATDDVIDAAVTSEREVAEALVSLARDAAAELEAALARMDAGTYGRCTSCGDAIPFERLEAIPATRFCVRCPRPTGLFG